MAFNKFKSGRFCSAAWSGDLRLVELLSADPTVDLNWQNVCHASPFSCACEKGHVNVVRFLLEFHDPARPIDYNLVNNYGDTPFSKACFFGHSEVVEILLGDTRINWNHPDKYQRPPLWLASLRGHLPVVKILLASLDQIDLEQKGTGEFNQTAVEVARENGRQEVAALLEAFAKDPEDVRTKLRLELGYAQE